jgi:fatty-acyl-CoA synthase
VAQVRDQCPDLRQSILLDDDWERLIADGKRTSPQDGADVETSLQFDDPISLERGRGVEIS